MLLREFKNVYKVKGARDLQSQVKYLTALAGIYHQKGVENADWVCLLKVSVCGHVVRGATLTVNNDVFG